MAQRALPSILAIAALLLPLGSRAADEPFDIYVTLPVTGQVAFLGSETAKGVRALEGYVNEHGGIRGRPVRFVIADDQSSPQLEVQLVSQELSHHPAVIVGGELTAMCRAAEGLISKEDGPVLYCLTPGVHPPKGSWVFSGTFSTSDMLAVTMRYMRERGITKLGSITTTDASGQDGDNAISAALALPENKGMSIVTREHFTVGDISVAAQLTRIENAGAQGIIAWESGSPFGTVIRGVRDAGIKLPVVTTPANLVYRQFEGLRKMMPAGPVWIPGIPSMVPEVVKDPRVHQAIVEFQKAMKQQGVERIDVSQTVPWDAMQIIVEAYRHFGTEATPAQIRDYIAGIRDWPGILGIFNYAAVPQRGAQQQWCVMLKWDNEADKFVAISEPGGAPLK